MARLQSEDEVGLKSYTSHRLFHVTKNQKSISYSYPTVTLPGHVELFVCLQYLYSILVAPPPPLRLFLLYQTQVVLFYAPR